MHLEMLPWKTSSLFEALNEGCHCHSPLPWSPLSTVSPPIAAWHPCGFPANAPGLGVAPWMNENLTRWWTSSERRPKLWFLCHPSEICSLCDVILSSELTVLPGTSRPDMEPGLPNCSRGAPAKFHWQVRARSGWNYLTSVPLQCQDCFWQPHQWNTQWCIGQRRVAKDSLTSPQYVAPSRWALGWKLCCCNPAIGGWHLDLSWTSSWDLRVS